MKKRVLTAMLATAMIIATTASLSGCGDKPTATPDTATSDIATNDTAIKNTVEETTDATATTEATTKSAEEKKKEDAIKDAELTVKDGKVVDKNGKEVTEVKTSDGTTVKVSASDVSSANSGNSGSSSNGSGSTSNKNNSSSSNNTSSVSSTNKPSSSSNNSGSGSSTSTDEHAGKTYHEAVYETIKHPAITEEKKIVDVLAYSYEKPIYEKHDRTICNDCGADLTDMSYEALTNHCCDHLDNGGKGSYHNEWREVQVGTETINVPEVYHYETVTIKDAWEETILRQKAGWY